MTALPSLGATFGDKYVVDSQLGDGGVGIVYAATHIELRQKVAIKVLRNAGPSILSERMIREARAALALHSEHVVRVMDVGRDAGRVYIVMEHLEGKDLAILVKERGHFAVAESVDYVLQACAGIAEAHARGIIHRDLKPSNLFLTQRADGTPLVKVLDFGISKTTESDKEELERSLTGPAEVLGSPMYMSPEQIRHASDVDHRTDIWSLGVVLFRFLTGTPPFDSRGGGVSGMLAAVVSDPPRPLAALAPQAPPGLEKALMKALAKSPADRWATVADLAGALAPFGTEDGRSAVARLLRSKVETSQRLVVPAMEPISVRALPAIDSRDARERTRRAWFIGGAVGLAIMAAVAVAFGLRAQRPSMPVATTATGTISAPNSAALATQPTTATAMTATATAPGTSDSPGALASSAAASAHPLPTTHGGGRSHPAGVSSPAPPTTATAAPPSTARAAATNDRY